MKLFGGKKKSRAKKPSRQGRPSGSAAKKYNKNKKRHRILIIAGISLLAVILALVAAWNIFVSPPPKPTPPTVKPSASATSTDPGDNDNVGDAPEFPEGEYKKDFFTFLLFATDVDNYNSDVIMVASFDVANKKCHVVNIPRDSAVNVKRSNKKINAAYGYAGGGDKGVDKLMSEISEVIGFKPDYYVHVKIDGFMNLVDAVGGVYFDVPFDMKHVDANPELSINLKKGPQTLDGKKALQLVRFRNSATGEDLGRISRSQDFLKALAKQTLKAENIFRIGDIMTIAMDNIKTDLTYGNLIWFAQRLMELDSEKDIEFHTVPHLGTGMMNGISYLFLDEKGIVELVNETINPYQTPITTKNIDILKKTSSSGSTKPKPPSTPTPSSPPTQSASPDPGQSEETPSSEPTDITETPSPDPTDTTETPSPPPSPPSEPVVNPSPGELLPEDPGVLWPEE